MREEGGGDRRGGEGEWREERGGRGRERGTWEERRLVRK